MAGEYFLPGEADNEKIFTSKKGDGKNEKNDCLFTIDTINYAVAVCDAGFFTGCRKQL